MRFALVVAFASCLIGTSSAQRADDEPIRVILPPDVDDATCHVDSQIDAPMHVTFRALAACPGYRIWTAVDALPDPEHRRINAVLEPSPKVRFSGVIRGWATPTVRYRVHIVHFPGWKCTFFRRSDCMLAMWTLARVPVAADGTFSAELPDLANDPVFKSFGSSADVLRLGLREVSTLNRAFEPRPSRVAPSTAEWRSRPTTGGTTVHPCSRSIAVRGMRTGAELGAHRRVRNTPNA